MGGALSKDELEWENVERQINITGFYFTVIQLPTKKGKLPWHNENGALQFSKY